MAIEITGTRVWWNDVEITQYLRTDAEHLAVDEHGHVVYAEGGQSWAPSLPAGTGIVIEGEVMNAEPTLTLFSECLLSKYGFNDGDEPDAWLDWCEERGIDYNAWDWHPVLRRLVREHLLPKLGQHVEVYDIETIHNPIRADTVNGVVVDDVRDQPEITLTPDSVEVPYSEVLRIARLVSEDEA